MKELSHYINGEYVKGTSGRFADVFNPATGEVQAKVPLASEEEMQSAVAVAQSVQPDWAAVNPQRRARVMMKFVDLLNRDMDKLAEALSKEHGKTFPDARFIAFLLLSSFSRSIRSSYRISALEISDSII